MTRWSKSVFWRLLLRSLSVRRPQAALAMGSLVVGAAVTSMLLNLYGDARRKMTQEFRAYGANVLLVPRVRTAGMWAGPGAAAPDASAVGGLMAEDTLERLRTIRKRTPGLAAAPVLYVVARLERVPRDPRLPEFQNAVAVGTDFAALRGLFPTWQLQASEVPSDAAACVIGAHIATRLRLSVGDRVALGTSESGEPLRREFRIAGLLSTGASEDDQVFVPLEGLQRLAKLEGRISLIELSVPGERREVERTVGELAGAFPELEARPIRQIVESEGRILLTLRSLLAWLAIFILVITALCVAATMTAIALERRKDIAVMKALGAGDRRVLELFLGEGAILGLAGGTGGFALGAWVAHYLAARLFDVSLRVVWWTLPLVCLASVLVALVATSFPVRIIRAVEPAAALKGE